MSLQKKTLMQFLGAIAPEVRGVGKFRFLVCMWSTAMYIVCGFKDNPSVSTVVGV